MFNVISVDPSADTWIVLVSSVDGRSGSIDVTAALAANELRRRGFKIHVIGISGPDGTLDETELSQLSSDGTVTRLTGHDQLPAALADFGSSQLCLTMADPPRDETLCTSARMKDGVGYRYHPTDCDKFIQCHYNTTSGATVAVYRTCPMGQYWDQGDLECDDSCDVDCPEGPCMVMSGKQPVVQFSRDKDSMQDDDERRKHRHSRECNHWYSSALLWDSEMSDSTCTDQFDLVTCQCAERELREQGQCSGNL
nr:hypothetical protein BaRGS_000694 [Batillaria attramentaria]